MIERRRTCNRDPNLGMGLVRLAVQSVESAVELKVFRIAQVTTRELRERIEPELWLSDLGRRTQTGTKLRPVLWR